MADGRESIPFMFIPLHIRLRVIFPFCCWRHYGVFRFHCWCHLPSGQGIFAEQQGYSHSSVPSLHHWLWWLSSVVSLDSVASQALGLASRRNRRLLLWTTSLSQRFPIPTPLRLVILQSLLPGIFNSLQLAIAIWIFLFKTESS